MNGDHVAIWDCEATRRWRKSFVVAMHPEKSAVMLVRWWNGDCDGTEKGCDSNWLDVSKAKIHSFIHSTISSIHPSTHPSISSHLIYSSIQSATIYPFIYSSIHPFIHKSIFSFIHLSIHLFIHPPIYSCIYVSINFHQGRIKRSACNTYRKIKRRITEVFQDWINDRLILILICSIAMIDKLLY
jgi:hypothetical protein